MSELEDLRKEAAKAIRAWLNVSMFDLKDIMKSLSELKLIKRPEMTLRQAYMIKILPTLLPAANNPARRVMISDNADRYVRLAFRLADEAIKVEEVR